MIAAALLASFLATRALPGDPVLLLADGRSADPEALRLMREAAGLDRSLPVQFAAYALDVLRGDLGVSLRYQGVAVGKLLAEAVPVTLGLVGAAALLAIPLGVLAGLAAAGRRSGPAGLLDLAAALVLSIPPLALSALMLSLAPDAPAAAVPVLAVPAALAVARLTRVQIDGVLPSDFIRTARAKGGGGLALIVRHALPHALGPLAAACASLVGALLTGAAAVESVFALPGLGRLAVQAVAARDHPVAGGAVLALVLIQVAASLLAELAIILCDPRLRAGGERR